MNRAIYKEQKRESPPSSPANSKKISIGGSNGSSNNNGSGLMDGNGVLNFRRSPISHHPQQSQHASYCTLTSPSINNSFNSEEISDLINSSSLEEEQVHDLSQRFEQLQRQVEVLSETQASQDDRYRRSRQENDELLNKIHCLEDQLRELEVNSEIRAQEDERRFKKAMAKQMTVKSQECEQHLNANYLLQQDIIALQKDLLKSEALIRTLRSEKETIELELNEKNSELLSLDDEVHKLKLLVSSLKEEETVKSNLISILNEELEGNQKRSHKDECGNQSRHSGEQSTISSKQMLSSSRRSSITSDFCDDLVSSKSVNNKMLKEIDALEANMSKLRNEIKRLKETNEELQAQLLNVQLEEGRSLIQEGNKSYSLADELGHIDVQKLMRALKEQQEDNARLRKYIDDILLKIVENNPEILEKTVTSAAAHCG